jgi:holo-[acyl-carrier protein] synthase
LSRRVLGVGIDTVDVDRFRTVLARRPTVATRLFTTGELDYAGATADPAPRLAARFAAKEAAMKALGVGLGAFAFRDVEVARAPSGQPSLVLSGSAAELASQQGVESFLLSLSHTALVAQAVVLAEGGGAGS